MKKSTILLVLMVYVVSFFIVGFLGIAVRSAYSLTYVKELTVTELADQPTLTLMDSKRIENTAIDDEHTTYTNEYSYTFTYAKDTVLKFKVDVKPVESTYRKFNLINMLESDKVQYEVKDDSLIYITFKKRRDAEFKVESTDGSKTYSLVKISAL